jgi:hypothetical protein
MGTQKDTDAIAAKTVRQVITVSSEMPPVLIV